MSAPDEDTDELLSAYRRASDAEAGRPAAATRAAILAEARVASARRLPAANDSRFAWRVAAGLAVVGVALLVWRQLPRDALAPLEAPAAGARAPVNAAANAAARSQSAEAPAPRPDIARPRIQERASAAAAAAPPPPPIIVDLDVRQPVPEAMSDIPRPSQDIDALVRRAFPALLGDATPPAGVWIVQDAAGRALRTGTLATGESLGTVMGRLQNELPGRQLRPFEIASLRTTRGVIVLVGISRVE